MGAADEILEERTFRLLPAAEIGFSKPAIEHTLADGTQRVTVARSFSAPEPELARRHDDPGWWTITVWLPVGATPTALVPDPSAPVL